MRIWWSTVGKTAPAAAASATPGPTKSATTHGIANAARSTKLGKAVVRNRIRRRLREIYRLHERQIVRGYDLVVVSRVRACTADYHQLEAAFLSACAQLGLLTEGDDGA